MADAKGIVHDPEDVAGAAELLDDRVRIHDPPPFLARAESAVLAEALPVLAIVAPKGPRP